MAKNFAREVLDDVARPERTALQHVGSAGPGFRECRTLDNSNIQARVGSGDEGRMTAAKTLPRTALRSSASDRLKRAVDLILTFLLVAIFSPVLLAVPFLIRVKLGGPVLFRQQRPGLNGESFQLIKFRTMIDSRGADGELLPDSQRLTRFGRMLRATSLDELPELWNVWRGEMSFVGPRPLLVEYLPLYSPEQSRRHTVLPGITGLAQVSGRNAISWDEKLKLDVWYVDNRSLWLDLKIIARTVWCVCGRSGISATGEATAPKFAGNK